MEIKPLKKEIYARAVEIGVESIELNFSGGNDEGNLNITITPENLHRDCLVWLESAIYNWVWEVYSYSGAGDGNDYGDDIVYNLREGTTSHAAWHTAVNYDKHPRCAELMLEGDSNSVNRQAIGRRPTKTITLQEAYTLLEGASALMVDNNILVYAGLNDLTGDDRNEFLYLRWEDDGRGYTREFEEGFNREVDVEGSSLFLFEPDASDDDDCTKITLLVPQKLT
jgi:hypothetical protein